MTKKKSARATPVPAQFFLRHFFSEQTDGRGGDDGVGVERTPSSSPPRQLCALMGPFCQAFLRPCLSSHELRSCTSPFWGHEGLHERDLIERADIRRYAWQRERRPPHFSANFHDVRIRYRRGSPAAARRRRAPPSPQGTITTSLPTILCGVEAAGPKNCSSGPVLCRRREVAISQP